MFMWWESGEEGVAGGGGEGGWWWRAEQASFRAPSSRREQITTQKQSPQSNNGRWTSVPNTCSGSGCVCVYRRGLKHLNSAKHIWECLKQRPRFLPPAWRRCAKSLQTAGAGTGAGGSPSRTHFFRLHFHLHELQEQLTIFGEQKLCVQCLFFILLCSNCWNLLDLRSHSCYVTNSVHLMLKRER